MNEEQVSSDGSWMNDITPKTATLKVRENELVKFVFKSNGKKKPSIDYGESIAFLVKVDGDEEIKTFYVKANNFDLLGRIKEIAEKHGGNLFGLHCELSRKGSKRSDTRYNIIEL